MCKEYGNTFSPSLYLGGALKRPASTENDKEVKKAKLELENAITKKEIKDEKPINDRDIKKHLKQLTREVSKTRHFITR